MVRALASGGVWGPARRVGPRWLVVSVVVLATSACGAARSSPPGDAAPGSPETLLDEGRAVFLEVADPGCGLCHTLRAAGATGTLGPDLDQLRPDAETVVAAVTGGVGIMGAQEHLTSRQVQALATYVAQVAGGARP